MIVSNAIPHCLVKAPRLPNLDRSFILLDVLGMETTGESSNPHLGRRRLGIRIEEGVRSCVNRSSGNDRATCTHGHGSAYKGATIYPCILTKRECSTSYNCAPNDAIGTQGGSTSDNPKDIIRCGAFFKFNFVGNHLQEF